MRYLQITTGPVPDAPLPWWLRVLAKLFPSARTPEMELLIGKSHVWWLEIEDNGLPQREIGFDAHMNPVVLGPIGDDIGFLIDASDDWSDSKDDSPEAAKGFNAIWRSLWPKFEHLDDNDTKSADADGSPLHRRRSPQPLDMLQESEKISRQLTLPRTVYTIGDCPVGCGGDDLVVLQNRETRDFFLYCPMCGVAHRPDSVNLDELLTCKGIAPEGIAFPSRAEVVAAFGDALLQEHEFELGDFWNDLAHNYLADDCPAHALLVAEYVIRTWYRVPSTAYLLRTQAQEAIKLASSDEKQGMRDV